MLPSLLASDIKSGLKNFLVTGFEPNDQFMNGLMSRFVNNEASWLKGPYVQLGLPFVKGQASHNFFQPTFLTTFPGYSHQEAAWSRLASNKLAANTLVATGTGSGKTECFLYPVLDHCARMKAEGQKGIKALIIYPMNALANDQARRIAKEINKTKAFSGLTAGLYVGGNAGEKGKGLSMAADSVITDRDTMRENPPDILLTNYKMLDYLMIRPGDKELWAKNQPDTLRYIVVDELHTFDGAQGTDLALLLRRLRHRLQIPADKLICAGTSATLGGSSDTSPLREYARQVFGVDFPPESVITENRQTTHDFLGTRVIEYLFSYRSDYAGILEPSLYKTPEEAVRAWYPLFFEGLVLPENINDSKWRTQLGEQLKGHLLFVNLLRILNGKVVHYDEIVQAFGRLMPAASPAEVSRVLDALLVLAAWTQTQLPASVGQKSEDAKYTFLCQLRIQLWVKELRRMVAKVATKPSDVVLTHAKDLPVSTEGVYLPLIQCRQCRTTGWLTRLVETNKKVLAPLDEIYNTWFNEQPSAARIYAASAIGRSPVKGYPSYCCTNCGTLDMSSAECRACGGKDLLKVFVTSQTKSYSRNETQYTKHDDTCPACGDSHSLILLGARNATLGSQVVESTWSSVFNDDKKLIAFSDSVQDAAHRAGFFGARTYLNNIRTAVSKTVDEIHRPGIKWSEFNEEVVRSFDNPSSVLHMKAEELVSEFIAPNMAWQRDWAQELLKKNALPLNSRLPQKVKRRIVWQIHAEFTYMAHRGRTLERIGKATLAIPHSLLQAVAEELHTVFAEEFGLRHLQVAEITHWLWGFLWHMRQRGGVLHPELKDYFDDGVLFKLLNSGGRREYLPSMGRSTPRPIFLSLGKHPDFDVLAAGGAPTWYQKWLDCTLGRNGLLPQQAESDLYMKALELLVNVGVLVRGGNHDGETIGLNPASLVLHKDTALIGTKEGKRSLVVPADDAVNLLQMPCVDSMDESYSEVLPENHHGWWAKRFSGGSLRRVIPGEHTGLLERSEREALESRFKSDDPKPWFENLLSATPTLEMGVDIGDLSSVLLCSVPPNQASFLQRIGRAGRRDGNAMTTTLADGSSPHDLYFFEEIEEMMSGEVAPPGIFLRAAEVLRRQLFAFCMDNWVATLQSPDELPQKTSTVLDAVESGNLKAFPYTLCDFVTQNEPVLYESFVGLLDKDIDDEVKARLLDFIQGQGEQDGLKSKLVKHLQELLDERKSYKERRKSITNEVNKLKKPPVDEATQDVIDRLQLEKDKLQELIAEINKRDLLNTLTDAGLIPNYAFPEAGIQLKSVLWRKRAEDEQGDGKYVTLGTIKYERSAQSALSEFAPENRFFANQRKVEIDQINMALATVEEWRFCPSCHYMQNLTVVPDTSTHCPRCSDPMWADGGQSRKLLRFKQAIANSDDTKVRIDDTAEDREPKFYVRQLMADFNSKDVREAWKIKNDALPFGFEFISRAVFRDVNFGEMGRNGEQFKVADVERSRPGFLLCKECGKVQPPAAVAQGAKQEHSMDCSLRDSTEPKNLLDCLYLYREFESEALRILVPYTKNGVDESVVQSFMAAVQLGLKKRFGGKVDHLRMVLQDEPGKDGGPRKYFVMLFDSVPGGTGYLHQLLAKDAGTLREVLSLSLNALNTCSCNQDPEKDGCYRCLYQYRMGRSIDLVSRETSKRVLTDLVASLDQLERVSTISEIYINPAFDSVLEGQFIEALRKLGGQGGLPRTKVLQEIVNGKSGFLLEVAGERYRLEPQCDLSEYGLEVLSKPDFVIWPWSARNKRKPIAVFCDGWAFHKDILRDDARKRSALVASGKFWVWSLTYEDVKLGREGEAKALLESASAVFSHNTHPMVEKLKLALKPGHKSFLRNSMSTLLEFLAKPAESIESDPSGQELARDAMWLNVLTLVNPQNADLCVAEQRTRYAAWLPKYVREPEGGAAACVSKRVGLVSLFGTFPKSAAQGLSSLDGFTAPGCVLIDDEAAKSEDELLQSWKVWLHLFNFAQTLPGVRLCTLTGLKANDYDAMDPDSQLVSDGVDASQTSAASNAEWQAVLDDAMPILQAGLERLMVAGCSVPSVGEFQDPAEGWIEDAELAFASEKVVLLRDDQSDLVQAWQGHGWTVLLLNEEMSMVDDQEWPLAVANAVGVSL